MIKLKNVINKHKSNKIKENSNTVRHLNNGTDHRHSKSCCDQSSPARRTIRRPLGNLPLHKYVAHSPSLGRVAIPDWSQAKRWHTCVSQINWSITGSDNCLSPVWPLSESLLAHLNPGNRLQLDIDLNWTCWIGIYFVYMAKTYICLVQINWRFNFSRGNPTYTRDPILFITIPLDTKVLRWVSARKT